MSKAKLFESSALVPRLFSTVPNLFFKNVSETNSCGTIFAKLIDLKPLYYYKDIYFMIWDSVDDWDEPRFRAKQDENDGASDVMRQ